MTGSKERFHRAARDNYLDLLKEANSSEADAIDENGMSPVMWAAFYGNLEALRLLISRGGNPDKADFMGSTALHFSALNGHMHCVSFLVNFGANIWTLDNDLHTALDLASLREHQEIVDYLDSVATKQYAMNKRVVAKMREKASLQAQKRIKKYNKMLKKSTKKAAKEDRRLQEEQAAMTVTLRRGQTSNPNYRHTSLEEQQLQQQQQQQHSHLQLPQDELRLRHRNGSSSSSSQRAYSEYLTSSRSAKSRSVFGAARKIVGHRRNDKDDDNRSQDIVYARSAGGDSRSLGSGPTSEPDLAGAGRPDSGLGDSGAGLFERPGFGSVAFFHQNPIARTLKSFKEQQQQQQQQQHQQHLHHQDHHMTVGPASPGGAQSVAADSIGTSASLLRRWRDLPWSEEEVENLDDDNDTLAPHTELELFLACLGVTEYMPAFTAERIDLEALSLCNQKDLQDLGLPLGPRKKILEALQRRKEAMSASRSMQDLRL